MTTRSTPASVASPRRGRGTPDRRLTDDAADADPEGTTQSGPQQASSRPDLDDPAEIAEMVRTFYADVAQDDVLGPVFNDVAHVDWAEHLPKLTRFWCRALLGVAGYEGNPYRMHQEVHHQKPLVRAEFERWLDLFYDTLDSRWAGPKVDQAKAFAQRVAAVHSRQIIGDEVIVEPPTTPSIP